MKSRIVIIGNGIAANAAAEEIRNAGHTGPVIMIAEENEPLYTQCAFKKYLSNEINRKKLYLKTFDDYAKLDLTLYYNEKATCINIDEFKLVTNKREITFDKLILAVGSKPKKPKITGIEKTGIFYISNISSVDQILNYKAKNALVIGSGPIGIEACIALTKRKINTTICEIMPQILPGIFDFTVSKQIEKILIKNGIRIIKNVSGINVLGDRTVNEVQIDRQYLNVDMIIVCVGAIPNNKLAMEAGIGIGKYGGISVDKNMMTNVENIFACGDCAEALNLSDGERIVRMLWPVAKRQGMIAGHNSVLNEIAYSGSINMSCLDIFGNCAFAIGDSKPGFGQIEQPVRIIEEQSGTGYLKCIYSSKKLVSFQGINVRKYAGIFESLIRLHCKQNNIMPRVGWRTLVGNIVLDKYLQE